jgi:hypothetical protein
MTWRLIAAVMPPRNSRSMFSRSRLPQARHAIFLDIQTLGKRLVYLRQDRLLNIMHFDLETRSFTREFLGLIIVRERQIKLGFRISAQSSQ